MADSESRTRPYLAFIARWYGDCDSGGNHGAATGREFDWRLGWHRREQIESCCKCTLIGRQWQVSGVGQPDDAHFGSHGFAPPTVAAMRSISARATSSFDCGGQDSTLSALIR